MKNNILTALTLIILISCESKSQDDSMKNNQSYVINAVDYVERQSLIINDSVKNYYSFYDNRRLKFFTSAKGDILDGQVVYFYESGNLESVTNVSNGLNHGISIKFYSSGNIKRLINFKNDSLRGYYIDYYDKPNCKKAEYLASPVSDLGYIYKRSYDSISQKVIDIMDHREIELRKNPNLSKIGLKLPWE